MGFETSAETIIDAPRDLVWAYLTDFARHTEWADPKHMLRIQPPSDVRTGATFTSIGKDMGRDERNVVTITEIIPGHRIVYDANMVDKGVEWRNVLELADAGSRTRVIKREAWVRGKFPYSAIVTLLAPLLRIEAAKINGADLARIKTVLERRLAEVA